MISKTLKIATLTWKKLKYALNTFPFNSNTWTRIYIELVYMFKSSSIKKKNREHEALDRFVFIGGGYSLFLVCVWQSVSWLCVWRRWRWWVLPEYEFSFSDELYWWSEAELLSGKLRMTHAVTTTPLTTWLLNCLNWKRGNRFIQS